MSFLLNGSSQYIDTNASGTLSAGGVTLIISIRPDTNKSAAQDIVMHGTQSTSQNNYGFNMFNSGVCQFYFWPSTGGDYVRWRTCGIEISAGTWHHICVTHTFGNSALTAIYMNGVEVSADWSTGNGDEDPSTHDNGTIVAGAKELYTAGNYFDGTIARLMVVASAVTSHQAMAITNGARLQTMFAPSAILVHAPLYGKGMAHNHVPGATEPSEVDFPVTGATNPHTGLINTPRWALFPQLTLAGASAGAVSAMSLAFLDGCDHYACNTDIKAKYHLTPNTWASSPVWTSTGSKWGTGAVELYDDSGAPTGLGFQVSGTTSAVYAGLYYKPPASGPTAVSHAVLSFRQSGTPQATIQVDSTLALQVIGGSTTVLASTGGVYSDTWHRVEALAKKDSDGSGLVLLYVSGAMALSYTGSGMLNAGASAFDQVLYTSLRSGTATTYDDLFIYTVVASVPTSAWIGSQARVRTHYPNADDSVSWTAQGGGDNYVEVDDTAPDDNTTYVHTSATGSTTDVYGISNATGTWSASEVAKGAQVVAYVTQVSAVSDAGGSVTLQATLSGTTVSADTASVVASAAYDYHLLPLTSAPGASAWEVSNVDNVTVGITRV